MNEEKELSFFRKMIISIKNFEKYPELASKKIGVVLSYLIKLLAIFTIIVSIVCVYKFSLEFKNVISNIETEIPNFTFKDNKLHLESNSAIFKENLDGIFNTIIIDTNEISKETENSYNEIIKKTANGIIVLQDKLIIKNENINGNLEYSYEKITEKSQIYEFDKQQFLEYFSGMNLKLIYIGFFIITYIYMFLIYITGIWVDILFLAVFGYITGLILRIRIRFAAMCKIAIHSLTLPIILNVIVILLETFTSFRVKYFEFMYIGIACVYILTAILMIKSDLIKHKEELMKIIEEQEKVKEELERQEEEKQRQKQEEKQKKERKREEEKNKKEDNQPDTKNDEPQGENA